MNLRIFIFALLFTAPLPGVAAFQAPNESVLLPANNTETKLVSGLKDERVGLRTGSLDYSTVDVRLQGLGPDITVRRTFAKTGDGPVEFGSWVLDVPRIVLSTNPGGWPAGGAEGANSQAGICNDYSNPKFYPLEGEYSEQSANWHTSAPLLYLGDGSSERLITVNPALRGILFPSNTKYVTASNVVVSCIEVGGRFDGYEVKTPDGLTYELSKLSRIPGDFIFGGKAGKNIISVSRIRDQLGNEVEYLYREVRKPGVHGYSQFAKPNRYYVEEIASNDGRKVVFAYQENALEGEYPLIDSIEVKGAEGIYGGSIWNYTYTGLTSSMGSDYCHFLSQTTPAEEDRCRQVSKRWYQGTYLKTVSRPDGSSWEFDYRGPIVGSLLDCCSIGGAINHLTRVKFPTGGVASYQYGQLPYLFFDDSHLVYETPVVKKRTLYDPITNTTNEWNYSYSHNTSANYTRTTVVRPDNSKSIDWFYRSGTHRGSNYKSQVLSAGSPIRTTIRTFESGTNLGTYIGPAKFPTNYTGVAEEVIDGKYTRSVESRDALFREMLVAETGNASRTIATSHVALADLEPDIWMLNLTEERIISKPGGAESAKVERAFYPNGLLKSHTQFGVHKGDYRYTARGELSEISTLGAQEIKEERSDFYTGKPRSIEFSDGAKISLEYDVFGNTISEVDELGNETTFKFDALGRYRLINRPALAEVQFTYHPYQTGQPARLEMKKGNTLFLTQYFDGFGQLLASETQVDATYSTQNNDSIIKRFRYNHDGKLSFASYPSSGTVSTSDFLQPVAASGIEHSYDALSRLTKSVETSSGSSVEHCYDQVCQYGYESYDVTFGELIVDERGYKTVNRFDCFSNPEDCVLTKIKRKVNNPSKNSYVVSSSTDTPPPDKWVTINIDRDILGNPVRLENDGVIRSFSYFSGTPLVRSQTEPEALPVTYSYYPNGSIKTKAQGDKLRSYHYSKRGLLTHVNAPEGNLLEADYYPNGKIQNAWSRIDGRAVRTHFNYTTFGSVLDHQQYPMNGAGPTKYEYNQFGHINRMIYPHGDVVEYSPDLLGRATKLTVNGSELATVIRRDEEHLMTMSNGVVVEKRKNDRGLSTSLLVKPVDVEVGVPDSLLGSPILEYDYGYDRADNLTLRQDKLTPSLSKSFAFDGLSRLIWDGAIYSYDDNSNMTSNAGNSITYENNKVRRLQGSILKEFEHDEYGRLTTTHVGSTLSREVRYNDLDRVESIASGGATTLYTYDAFGRLSESHSLNDNASTVDTTRFFTDLFGRVLEKEIGVDPTAPDRLVRFFYIENSLVAEKEVVENAPPTVDLRSISKSTEEGQRVLLNADAYDREDGDLSNSIVWVSDIAGNIATGRNTSAVLSVGVHQISAKIVDSDGLASESNPTTVSIQPGISLNAKVREISKTNPDSYEFVIDAAPTLETYFDFFLNGRKIVGSGTTVSVPDVSFGGNNTIYLCLQNSKICSNTLDVASLEKLNESPVISDLSTFGNLNESEPMTFTATAIDREDGNLTYRINWYLVKLGSSSSNPDFKNLPPFFYDAPVVGTGGTYTANFNSPGHYAVKAEVTDNYGLESSVMEYFEIEEDFVNLGASVTNVKEEFVHGQILTYVYYVLDINVTNGAQFNYNLNFYARERYSSSWNIVSASKRSYNSTFVTEPLNPEVVELKVCNSNGNYCSAEFSFTKPYTP